MHTNTGYRTTRPCRSCDTTSTCSSGRSPRAARRSSRRRARASARSATSTPRVARRAGDEALAVRAEAWPRAPTSCPSCWSTCSGSPTSAPYYPHRVTYHPTCHSLRLLRVGDRPLRLLRAVRGIDLVELPAADSCCGFGGTFARQERRHLDRDARRQDGRRALDARRGRAPPATRRASCTSAAGCPGCARARRTVHLAEILASTT